jgi:putative transcriptional regulator
MKKKDVVFNAEELLKAVEETRDHVLGKRRITMRTTEVELPPRVGRIKPAEVAAIRHRLRVSQTVFARILNVPTITEVSWEKGRRHPSGAALRLLQIARKHPRILLEA